MRLQQLSQAMDHQTRLFLGNRATMVVAIAHCDARYARSARGQHVVARVADEQRLRRLHPSQAHHLQQRRWVRLLLRQGIATNDPAEITTEADLLQQRRDETLRLVGHHGEFDSRRAQRFEQLMHARVKCGQVMTVGIDIEKARQRLFRLGFTHGGVNVNNIREIAAAGADTFVAGSAIFNQPDYKTVIDAMRAELAQVRG